MKILSVVSALLLLQACSAPIEKLKPVANQNQENIKALAQNTQVLVSVYQILLDASGETLINQYISQITQELVAVIGVPPLDQKADTWATAFKQVGVTNSGKHYQNRYNNLVSALASDLDDKKTAKLRYAQGWIFSAVTDKTFTPTVAYELVGSILKLKRTHAKDLPTYFKQAEKILSPYDSKLVLYRQSVIGAEILLNALKQDITKEIETAYVHSYLLSNYADTKTDFNKAVADVAKEDIKDILMTLGTRYIKSPTHRNAAVKLLTTGLPE